MGPAKAPTLQPPGFIVPCQPTLSATVPRGDGWLRLIVLKDGDRVWLWSRNGRDWCAEFLAIAAAVRTLPFKRIMLDGRGPGALP